MMPDATPDNRETVFHLMAIVAGIGCGYVYGPIPGLGVAVMGIGGYTLGEDITIERQSLSKQNSGGQE